LYDFKVKHYSPLINNAKINIESEDTLEVDSKVGETFLSSRKTT